MAEEGEKRGEWKDRMDAEWLERVVIAHEIREILEMLGFGIRKASRKLRFNESGLWMSRGGFVSDVKAPCSINNSISSWMCLNILSILFRSLTAVF